MVARKNLYRTFRKAILQPEYARHAFWKRAKSALSYHLFNGYSSPPETISLFLTYKCNLRCHMCGQWGEYGAFKDLPPDVLGAELPMELIEKLLAEAYVFRPNITLFGGEPLLHKNVADIIRLVKSYKLRCNMVTNGLLLSKYAKDIVGAGMDEIIVSLDGPEEIHDIVRNVPGGFKRSTAGVMLLTEHKREMGRKKPIININCTITEPNYMHLDRLIPEAEKIGASSINYHHLLFVGGDAYHRHNEFFKKEFKAVTKEWEGFVWPEPPKIDPEGLIKKKKEILAMRPKIDIFFYPNFTDDEIRAWYSGFDFKSTSYKNRCLSIWITVYIFPNGSVRPYHTMDYSLGNLYKSSFKEIWNNPRYIHYRRVVKKIKGFPVCAKGCTEFYRY